MCVDCRQRIVEKHDVRPTCECTSECSPLFLSAGEVDTPLPEHGIESTWKLSDRLRQLRNIRCPPASLCRRCPVGEIAGDRVAEEKTLLGYITDFRAQCHEVQLTDRNAVD